MPGYRVITLRADQGLLCSSCKLVLRDAIQLLCNDGTRLCRSCYRQWIDDHPHLVEPVQFFTDKAAQREVEQLELLCQQEDKGCKWRGKLNLWQDHSNVCQYAPVPCLNEGCGVQPPRHSHTHHTKEACPYRRTTCQFCGRELPIFQLGSHYEQCTHFGCPAAIDHQMTSTPKGFLAASEPSTHQTPEPECPFQTPTAVQDSTAYCGTGTAVVTGVLGVGAPMIPPPLHPGVIQQLRCKVEQLERKMEQLEKTCDALKGRISDLDGGSFLWKITEVSKKRKDAIERGHPSVCSDPFYTSRYGYRLCLMAHMNGEGGTHLSLYFVLMRGRNDAFLRWPFMQPISLSLVDQNGVRHISRTLLPTKERPFQQPSSDMNIAFGFPQFVPLSDLENFVKDDTMYIKCVVAS